MGGALTSAGSAKVLATPLEAEGICRAIAERVGSGAIGMVGDTQFALTSGGRCPEALVAAGTLSWTLRSHRPAAAPVPFLVGAGCTVWRERLISRFDRTPPRRRWPAARSRLRPTRPCDKEYSGVTDHHVPVEGHNLITGHDQFCCVAGQEFGLRRRTERFPDEQLYSSCMVRLRRTAYTSPPTVRASLSPSAGSPAGAL